MLKISKFKKLTKPKMVVHLIETMVFQGWDIMQFVYGFKAYKKDELIAKYQFHIDYSKKQD